MIRPVIYRKMNPYIQKILAITMKDLQGEEPLASVAKAFFDWCDDCDTLIAWSGNDFGVLEKNLAHIGMKIPEQLGRYDVQMAYAYRTENSIRNYALKPRWRPWSCRNRRDRNTTMPTAMPSLQLLSGGH